MSVYWELPDGTRAIEITNTPTIICNACEMTYQADVIVKEIEDQLILIDTDLVDKVVSFSKLMSFPRFLKRNYFEFTT